MDRFESSYLYSLTYYSAKKDERLTPIIISGSENFFDFVDNIAAKIDRSKTADHKGWGFTKINTMTLTLTYGSEFYDYMIKLDKDVPFKFEEIEKIKKKFC